jgi:hypothetical protein
MIRGSSLNRRLYHTSRWIPCPTAACTNESALSKLICSSICTYREENTSQPIRSTSAQMHTSRDRQIDRAWADVHQIYKPHNLKQRKGDEQTSPSTMAAPPPGVPASHRFKNFKYEPLDISSNKPSIRLAMLHAAKVSFCHSNYPRNRRICRPAKIRSAVLYMGSARCLEGH